MEFPAGRIERIYLHWSAGDYATTYDSYHYCVTFVDGAPRIVQTRDLRENMRAIAPGEGPPYAAHTAKRNSFAAGLSVMAMRDATPQDFGAYPLPEPAVNLMCSLAAAIANVYGIPIDAAHIMTHAEAAVEDGYFGAADDERWDIARLAPSPHPLRIEEAKTTGDELRRRIAASGGLV